MGRGFAGTQGLASNSAVLTALPITMAVWFRATSASGYQQIMGLNYPGTDNTVRLFLGYPGAGSLMLQAVFQDVAETHAVATTSVVAGQWMHGAGVITAAGLACYLNGMAKGTAGAIGSTPPLTDTTISYNSYRGYYFGGTIAEAAIWSGALPDGAIAKLALGVRPIDLLEYRPALVAYWPLGGIGYPQLDRDYSPRQRFPMGLVGTPTWSDHPPLIRLPRRAMWPAVSAGGAPATVRPWIIRQRSHVIGGGVS